MDRVIRPAGNDVTAAADVVESAPALPPDGEEVLFKAGADRWVLAEVVGRERNGELVLLCDLGDDLVSQRAVHGTSLHGWLTYDEAAAQLKSA